MQLLQRFSLSLAAHAKRIRYHSRTEDSANSVFSDDGNGMREGSQYFLSNKRDNIYTVEETGPQKGLVAIINNFTIESHRDFRGGKCYIVCVT